MRLPGSNVDIQLRSITRTADERAMGHCLFWPAIDVDAVSCTYNPEGFSPMLAVIRCLGRDRDHFTHPALTTSHQRRFSVMSHAFEARPVLITSSRTATWDAEPKVAAEIIRVADIERSLSLCMTHFSFLPGRFPRQAFEECVRAVMLAKHCTGMARITIDVDERHCGQAERVLRETLVTPGQPQGSFPESS